MLELRDSNGAAKIESIERLDDRARRTRLAIDERAVDRAVEALRRLVQDRGSDLDVDAARLGQIVREDPIRLVVVARLDREDFRRTWNRVGLCLVSMAKL